MRPCKLNKDENKECSALVHKYSRTKVKLWVGGKMVCDVVGEPVAKLKKCPLEKKK